MFVLKNKTPECLCKPVLFYHRIYQTRFLVSLIGYHDSVFESITKYVSLIKTHVQ
jgi:hypothetical protein